MSDQTVVPPEETPAPAETPQEMRARTRARVAKEMFGKEFYGEVEDAKPESKPEEPTPDKTIEGEVPAEGEQPEEGEVVESAPEDDSGEKTIETMSELAEHHEYDPEWVNSLKVAVTVDGRQDHVPLGDLVASYQKQEMVDQYLKEVREAKHAQDQERQAKQQEQNAQYQVLAELVKHEETALESKLKAIDPKLRDEDPAEWAARIQEFNQWRAQIEQVKANARAHYSANVAAQTAEANALRERVKAQEMQFLLEKLPEWRDPQLREKEDAELTRYALTQGFTPEDLTKLLDHRQVLILRKAALYDASRGQVDTAKKRVVKVPKIMKPGAPKPAEQRATERLAALKATMEKSGKIEDATAYRLAKRGILK